MNIESISGFPTICFISMLAIGFAVARRVDTKQDHRSLIQLIIYALYWFARWQYAVIKGIDVAYITYRQTLRNTALEIDNEKALGLVIPRRPPVEELTQRGDLCWTDSK